MQAEIDDEDDDEGDDGFGGDAKSKAAGKLAQAVAAAAANSGGSDDTEEVMGEFNFLSNPSSDHVDSIKAAAGSSPENIGKGEWISQFYSLQVLNFRGHLYLT